ncbi:MAG: hypothetical protein ACREJ2_15165 [Planctomycetota bacterium]
MSRLRPVLAIRSLRFVGLAGVAACALFCAGCYDEFMGPAPGDLALVRDQPGGSFRTGSVNTTEYNVQLFWGIWEPNKTNSWDTLQTGVKDRGADGAYDVQIETYMPWWHVFLAWVTGGLVDVSAHTVRAETFAFDHHVVPPDIHPAAPPQAPAPSAPPATPATPATSAPPAPAAVH